MKKALILGLGISGKSVIPYLKKLNYSIIEVDKHNENDPELLSYIDEIDFLVKSPGISWSHPLVKKAKGKVTSEVQLALQELKKSSKRIFVITGSNGKTTTTMLTAHILNHCGKKAVACGNIGLPLMTCIDMDAEILVGELSSYQTEDLEVKAIDIGVVLNITPNHLDRYDSFESYAKSKLHLAHALKEEGVFFVNEEIASTFAPFLPSYYKTFPDLQIKKENSCSLSLRYRDGRFSHDYENLRAAFSICREAGIEEEDFWRALSSFKKPPHRLEFVRKYKGVSFINDSKATSVDAVIKGVDSFSENLILIAGGVDKGGSYQSWSRCFKNKVKKVLLFGEARNKIYEEIHESLDTEVINTLSEALEKAVMYAKDGETVLFSPGCSSFDQFKSFEHRGDVFKTLVGKL